MPAVLSHPHWYVFLFLGKTLNPLKSLGCLWNTWECSHAELEELQYRPPLGPADPPLSTQPLYHPACFFYCCTGQTLANHKHLMPFNHSLINDFFFSFFFCLFLLLLQYTPHFSPLCNSRIFAHQTQDMRSRLCFKSHL